MVERDAASFCNRNGADLKSSFRKSSLMSRKILTGEFQFRLINTCIFPEMIKRIFIIATVVLSSCFSHGEGILPTVSYYLNQSP